MARVLAAVPELGVGLAQCSPSAAISHTVDLIQLVHTSPLLRCHIMRRQAKEQSQQNLHCGHVPRSRSSARCAVLQLLRVRESGWLYCRQRMEYHRHAAGFCSRESGWDRHALRVWRTGVMVRRGYYSWWLPPALASAGRGVERRRHEPAPGPARHAGWQESVPGYSSIPPGIADILSSCN